MSEFDPYKALLQNFSKHKFKLFIKDSILEPRNYPASRHSSATVNIERWENSDYAEMNLPLFSFMAYSCIASSRWIFQLLHMEDGLFKSDEILNYIKKKNISFVQNFVANEEIFRDLLDFLNQSNLDTEYRNSLGIYYVTNLNIKNAESKEYFEYIDEYEAEIHRNFAKRAKDLGLKIPAVIDNIDIGIGHPQKFLREEAELVIDIIKNIENRPDSINLQFNEGRIEVICTNKRKVNIYDRSSPKIILIDQIIDSSNYFLKQEVEEFEYLLNNTKVKEYELQKFLEANPKFILNQDYDDFRPQVALIDEDSQELKPDFFIKPIQRKLWEILEIKLPHVSLISGSRNREGLSSNVSRGIQQLMNYSKFFDTPGNRDRVRRATGIDVYKPKLTLVIGKKLNVNEALWNQIIEQERPFVNIVGFDEVLERAKKSLIKID